jgi:methylenetetrahydrofolate reductase (NADPH)
VDLPAIERAAAALRGKVDAANVTDNQAASVRMASIPVSALLIGLGLEPVMQITCRDRNRLAIQADLLGACALGIRNLLCLTGDHGRWGDHPAARNVYDLDSTHLIRIARNLSEYGRMDNGKPVSPKPQLFIGASDNPFAPPFEGRAHRLAKKIAAGARFIQTQLIFDVDLFRRYMVIVRDLGLTDQVYILAGVGPLKSAKQAAHMATKVPGMTVPETILRRMESTPKEHQADEGIKICCEIIEQVSVIPGVAGVHIMAVAWEEAVPEIIQRSGLEERRRLS